MTLIQNCWVVSIFLL